MSYIDLRSDTVTKPSPAMRRAMADATVGDDDYVEDLTVKKLEEMCSEMLGTEAALFVSSGTQSNLLALMSHCERGEEYIAGQEAHCYSHEGGGAAILGSIQPQPLDFETDGTLDLHKVEEAIKPEDRHFARTRLICLENTQSGKVLPLAYFPSCKELADKHKLKLHLDGARLFNAAVRDRVGLKDISRYFDSISICLSKGLGAPVGSVLCASAELIAKARRWRKVLGGGMRQAGILAAAGIFALQENVDRLEEDHEKASVLAKGLQDIEKLRIDLDHVQTNMVFAQIKDGGRSDLQDHMQRAGILVHNGINLRLVTHLDVKLEDINYVIDTFKDYFARVSH